VFGQWRRLVRRVLDSIEAGDPVGFHRAIVRMEAYLRKRPAADLTAAVADLALFLPAVGGLYAKLALVAGACVERGGSPLALTKVLPARTAQAMEDWARFPAVWAESTGRPLPDPQTTPMIEVESALSGDDGQRLTCAWYDVDDWINAAIAAMQHSEFRARHSDQERLRDASAAIEKDLESARWLYGLTVVLDDEPLVVLDTESGRGFRLRMSGIGDNFQLHTLLAHRLSSRIAAPPPKPSWVRAATSGPARLPVSDRVCRRFRLFDGHGNYIFPEGRPYDIQPYEGIRVLVLHPPNGEFAWTAARAYQRMTPTLTLESTMTLAESADWSTRVARARETDLMTKRDLTQ
jgi:hypothetical protein